MIVASNLSSSKDVQQSLLWHSFGMACFSGTVGIKRFRVRWNAALRELYGVAETQSPSGGPLYGTFVNIEDRQRLYKASEDFIASNAPMDVQFNATIAGTNKTLRVVIDRVTGTNRIVGVITGCDAKREEAVNSSSRNLWQSVGRLTLLDEVTSAMAHELNQPLAAISMFAQVGERMMASPEPRLDKAKQIFSDVSQQALRAGDLIHSMRNLVKRHPPSKIRLRVADLINEFASLAQPMARTHHVEFTVSDNFPAAIVFVDVTQINQVLSILFQNALDAISGNDAGRKSISVSAEQTNDKIMISITDSGPGVADDAAPQLFQAFFSTKENGNGLGLVSARNILEVYGSRIEFTNLAQGGCRFSFSLPIESRS